VRINVLKLIIVIVITTEPTGTSKRAETNSARVKMIRYAGIHLGVVFLG
jgi:hypothetical protein